MQTISSKRYERKSEIQDMEEVQHAVARGKMEGDHKERARELPLRD